MLSQDNSVTLLRINLLVKGKYVDWYTKYKEITMAEGVTYDDVTRATQLKMDNIPDLLFRYQSCRQENFDLLEQDHFWLSDPVDFNDPFDCALTGEIFTSANDEAFASSIAMEMAK